MFGNDIEHQYIHIAFDLVSSILLYRYVKRRISRHYAILGALLFYYQASPLIQFFGKLAVFFPKRNHVYRVVAGRTMLDNSKDLSGMENILRQKRITHIIIGVNGIKHRAGTTIADNSQESCAKLLNDHT
jgi:hypothetical protein